MKNVKWIVKEEFIAERYKRYLQKKSFIEKYDPKKNFLYLTDLDQKENGKLLKDTVICDSCNKDIFEYQFIMFENNRVYHSKCALCYPWFKLPDNVILLSQ